MNKDFLKSISVTLACALLPLSAVASAVRGDGEFDERWAECASADNAVTATAIGDQAPQWGWINGMHSSQVQFNCDGSARPFCDVTSSPLDPRPLRGQYKIVFARENSRLVADIVLWADNPTISTRGQVIKRLFCIPK